MRPKLDAQLYLPFRPFSDGKIVQDYRERYKRISDILDANPSFLDWVDADLRSLSMSNRGREATYTSEILLRALVVYQIEAGGFRDAIIRIAESPALQEFVRLGTRKVMDFTLLQKAHKALCPETWKAINDELTGYGVAQGKITPSHIRTDTTLVESNIHYPTDSSLLWDCFRVLNRLLGRARKIRRELCPNRFHGKKVKRLHIEITRGCGRVSKKAKREVGTLFGELIRQVGRIKDIAQGFCSRTATEADPELLGIRAELQGYLPSVKKVVSIANRVQLKGEKVPASERIFSLFEPHTELIQRGKKAKPVEFGHMVVLVQTREKFITDYEVMEHQEPDCEKLDEVIENHRAQFGAYPEVLAADTGFCADKEKMEELEKKVKVLAVRRRGRASEEKKVLPLWYRFRAGIEGSISVLKRAYRMLRSLFRGFKSFDNNVGLGVFCHNLVVLADLGAT